MLTLLFNDLIILLIYVLFQVHSEVECTAEAYTIRCHPDFSVALLDDLFHYSESEPNTVFIDLCGSLKFAKLVEKFWDVFFCDACSSVFHMHYKVTIWCFIASSDIDWALASEL